MKNPLRLLASRKFWQRSAFAVACLASVIAAFYVIEDYRGETAWARYRDDAKARGVKLDFQDFIPLPIPDAENFAAIPIFAQLGSRDSAVQKAAVEACKLPSTANAFGNGRDGKPADLAAESTLANRLAESWGDGRVGRQIDLTAWQECFALTGMIADRTDDPAADVLRAMERYEPIFDQMRAVVSRPRSWLNSGWEKGNDAEFWRMGGGISLGKLFSLHIAALLAADRVSEAFTDWRVQYRHSTVYQPEPTLLAGMLRVTLLQLLVNSTWRGIAAEKWTDAELAEIENTFSTVDLPTDYLAFLSSERAFFNLMMDEWRSMRHQQFGSFFGEAHKWSGWMLLPRGWIGQNQRHVNEWYDLQSEEVTQSLAGRTIDETALAKRRDAFHLPPWHPYWFIASSHFFMLGGNRIVCWDVQADLDLCRVACALRRFELANAAYPQTLNELVPDFMPTVPADRFDGQPLRYRRTDDGLVLYSIGKDHRDDGGDDEKDVAWRVPHPRTAEP